MQTYVSDSGAEFSYLTLSGPNHCIFIWTHGWMRSHRDLLPMATSLQPLGQHYLIDLPGFGESLRPKEAWGTEEYADFFAEWLKTLPDVPKIWIGHSFGCRIGIRLAAKYPQLIDRLFLIAAPGLPQKANSWQKLQDLLPTPICKLLKFLLPTFLREFFRSPDYRHAGEMKDIFLTTIGEDLSDISSRICCGTHFIYGEKDSETPPALGQRYQQLVANSTLTILPHLNHNTVLTEGRHQILKQLKELRNKIT